MAQRARIQKPIVAIIFPGGTFHPTYAPDTASFFFRAGPLARLVYIPVHTTARRSCAWRSPSPREEIGKSARLQHRLPDFS